MTVRQSAFTVEMFVETDMTTAAEHEKQVRYSYRNMTDANRDMSRMYYLSVVRDEDGNLLEFFGGGRGKPSSQLLDRLSQLAEEQRRRQENP